MKTLTVTSKFQARPGKEAELRAALTSLLAPTRKEPGCVNFDLHAALEEPGKFLIHHNWTSKTTFDVHLLSPHIQDALPRIEELCSAFPEVTLWERVD